VKINTELYKSAAREGKQEMKKRQMHQQDTNPPYGRGRLHSGRGAGATVLFRKLLSS